MGKQREMSDRLTGRIAVVTGAANGIGRASALALARAGADVAVLDLEGDRLASLADEIAATAACSPSPRTARGGPQSSAFARIGEHFGRVDILFNNVGQSAREKASAFGSRIRIPGTSCCACRCGRRCSRHGRWWGRCAPADREDHQHVVGIRRSMATPGWWTTAPPRWV